MIAAVFLILIGIYLSCGLLFALPFAIWGANRIDPHAKHGSWGFRLLIIPGACALWPVLLLRWQRGLAIPSDGDNSHRRLAKRQTAQNS